MIIKSIEMSNFRNYERAQLEFHEGTNVLFGDNAQGKTNVLEAIFVGGTTKSHKGSKDSEMIKSGEKEAHIRYFIEKRTNIKGRNSYEKRQFKRNCHRWTADKEQ